MAVTAGQSVTPPTQTDQIRALAALTGQQGQMPEDGAGKDILMVGMIAEALGRGVTWAQIGSALGCANGKAAKASAKRLAKVTQARMLRQKAEVASDG